MISTRDYIRFNSMSSHDFSTSLRYEQSKFPVQDKFYTEQLGAKVISRADFKDAIGRELQRKDIDVQFVYNGRLINVSEKNRQVDYGDLLFEFYSKFPHTRGWMDNSDADYLAYFVPHRVYWIDKRQLEEFYHKELKKQVSDSVFNYAMTHFPRRSWRLGTKLRINGQWVNASVLQAYNHPWGSEDEWYTESISIPYDCIRRAGISVQTFDIA